MALLSARRVWAGPGVELTGSPSPDGRAVSFVDWSTGNLAVRDFVTGTSRTVTGKGSWEDSPSFAEFSVFSPAGDQLAFAWFSDDWRYELRVLPRAGGEARVIFRDSDVSYVRPWTWTRDGSAILASISRRDGTVHLAMVPVEGGSAAVLRDFGWEPPRGADVSPDGRFVVYDVKRADPQRRDIFTLALHTGREQPLIDDGGENFVLGWAPDGDRVLFASDRGGTLGIWAVRVAGGQAAGEPVLVRPDEWRILPIGFAADGRYFYGVAVGTRETRAVSLDETTGRPVSPVLTLRGDAAPPPGAAWSPDGRFLATPVRLGGAGVLLRIHEPTGQTVRNIPTPYAAIYRVAWSADGEALFVHALDARRRHSLDRLDLSTGTISPLLAPSERLRVRHLDTSPDGDALHYVRNDPEGPVFGLYRYDLDSARETLLHAPGNLRIASLSRLSPDGRWLAFGEHPGDHNRSDAIYLMPATGGAPRLFHEAGEGVVTDLAWAPDGGHLILAILAGDGADAEAELWRVPLSGGDPESLGIAAPYLAGLHFHPDGRRLLFTAGHDAWELWVLGDAPEERTPAHTEGTEP